MTIPEQGSAGGVGEVGKQTPDKSPEQVAAERSLARRASVERAFEKAKATAEAKAATDDKDKGKPPAKSGENQQQPQQPEPAAKEPWRRRTVRLRAAGRGAPANEAGRPGAQQPAQRYAPLAETAPYREPPPRFSDAAKADWHGVPESVRGATDQAFRQYEQGIQQYRGAAEAFSEVGDYYQQARQDGTSLRTVLDNYTGMERKLRGDLFGGLELIIHNLGMQHPDGRRVSGL